VLLDLRSLYEPEAQPAADVGRAPRRRYRPRPRREPEPFTWPRAPLPAYVGAAFGVLPTIHAEAVARVRTPEQVLADQIRDEDDWLVEVA